MVHHPLPAWSRRHRRAAGDHRARRGVRGHARALRPALAPHRRSASTARAAPRAPARWSACREATAARREAAARARRANGSWWRRTARARRCPRAPRSDEPAPLPLRGRRRAAQGPRRPAGGPRRRSERARPSSCWRARGRRGGRRGARVRGEPDAAPERLAELHAGAVALVHPSLHEGFGLTLLEAMAPARRWWRCATPAVEEVCGDAALLVEPGELRGGDRARSRATPDLRERLARRRARARARSSPGCAAPSCHEQAYDAGAASRVRPQ